MSLDSIDLAIFVGRLNAICDEMGYTLQRSALSPNIKDRLDFSCAIFDANGEICAQAAHIPVHLGSMAFAMRSIVARFEWCAGDMLVLNDPFLGGTHLPDVTLVAPLFIQNVLVGFVANRAHHANIGSDSPGSMPLSKFASKEGVLISPVKLIEKNNPVKDVVELLVSIEGGGGSAKPELPGDFKAQVSANLVGLSRLTDWLGAIDGGVAWFFEGLQSLNAYGASLAGLRISQLPEGCVQFDDYLDSDGFGAQKIKISLSLEVREGKVGLDFSGTDAEVEGNINCPLSVCVASVYYVFVCLLPDYVPCCQGVFDHIQVVAPSGCLVNARAGAAVAAGNVETSMRIVDVVIGALAKLGVDMPACSQGSMNNVAFGSRDSGVRWDYYETIAGGGGASLHSMGLSAIQSHMTNTLNTPIESLEMHYPMRIEAYAVRYNSGGVGVHRGGDGISRVYRFLHPTSVTLLTERRTEPPWGINGGGAGCVGVNRLNGLALPAKYEADVAAGDLISIDTPGGGGWGGATLKE